MSDSSEDEDLSRFKEAVDTSFTKLINESRGQEKRVLEDKYTKPKTKSDRYLEESTHYNDVKVPQEMQKRIGAKISAILNKTVEFIDVQQSGVKKPKIKGGVKLFKDSTEFLSCEEAVDTYTEVHNRESRKIKRKQREIENDNLSEEEKAKAVAVSGEYVMSKEEIKLWKSRRKEKLFIYKSQGKGRVLTAVE